MASGTSSDERGGGGGGGGRPNPPTPPQPTGLIRSFIHESFFFSVGAEGGGAYS